MLRRVCVLRSFLFISLVITSNPLLSQENEKETSLEELYRELDSLFANEAIPDDLFSLVDSLLALDTAKYSTLTLRVGYVSNIVSAGRNFDFDQYGFSPGATYYHHSGIFGGVTGYWSNEYDPRYYLNNLTVGYMPTIKKDWAVSVNHDFYLFNDSLESHSFNKSVQTAVYYQREWADLGVDYAFLYGNDAAHRITARANGRIKIKPSGIIEAITLMPGASFQWGNANVFYLRQPRTAVTDLYKIVKGNDFPRLTLRNYRRLTYLLENDRQLAAAYFLRERGYTNEQISTTIQSYYAGEFIEEDTFGFMNYSFSLPVSVTSGRWNLLLSYTYNIPVALPGEDFEYPANGYFSTALSYLIYWKKN